MPKNWLIKYCARSGLVRRVLQGLRYGNPCPVVFKTYNSHGQLVRESREEDAFLFGKRMKHSKGGKTHAYSYKREGIFGQHTEITDASGKHIKRLDK
jgi:hypothetical protein